MTISAPAPALVSEPIENFDSSISEQDMALYQEWLRSKLQETMDRSWVPQSYKLKEELPKVSADVGEVLKKVILKKGGEY